MYPVPNGVPAIVTPQFIIQYGRLMFTDFGYYVVSAYNSCGSTRYWYGINILQYHHCRVVAPTPKNPNINFTISPNPSSENEITISKELSEQSEAKNEEFTLILYNKLQIKVRETTLNTLNKTISTEGLSNDVYFLHIISKDGVRVVRQVMILR